MTTGILTAEDRARAREARRIRPAERPTPGIPKAPREDTPPREWPVWALKMRHDLEAENHRLREELRELKASIMETERARAQRENNTALALYGESDDVKGLTKRLNYMLPNAQEIGDQGVALVAQIAIAHGLDPLPGSDHVYAWKQGGKLMVAIGYKGLLHLARQQVQFTHTSRRMTDDERDENLLGPQDIGYVTELYEISKAYECQQRGIPYFPIVGTAVWTPKDRVPAGKSGAWVAKKNSLKDALRQIVKTGVRMESALDAAFQQRDSEWAIPLAPQGGDEPDAQALIAAGMIKPDQDDDAEDAPDIIDQPQGDVIDATPRIVDNDTGEVQTAAPAPTPDSEAQPTTRGQRSTQEMAHWTAESGAINKMVAWAREQVWGGIELPHARNRVAKALGVTNFASIAAEYRGTKQEAMAAIQAYVPSDERGGRTSAPTDTERTR